MRPPLGDLDGQQHARQQAQQQQQMPIIMRRSSIGPPITAAFAASDKSFHHSKNPEGNKIKKRVLFSFGKVSLRWLPKVLTVCTAEEG